MRWKCREKTGTPLDEWHRWFAWHPVYVPEINSIVWLEYVRRIGQMNILFTHIDYCYLMEE